MHALEKASRISQLREISNDFLAKSAMCTKVNDVESFFELAQKASAQADELESDIKIESCWVYLQFQINFDYPSDYASYLEFCLRNGFQAVCADDYQKALDFVFKRNAG